MPPPPSSCPRYVLDALCAVDVAVRRRLAYAEADGTVTFDRAAIRARYRASGWLHADAACCAPVELVALLAAGSPGYRVALCLRASLRALPQLTPSPLSPPILLLDEEELGVFYFKRSRVGR